MVKYLNNMKLPTYLKEYIQDDCVVSLVLNKKTESASDTTEVTPRRRCSANSTTQSQFDLTGSPLKVELNCDDDFEWTVVCERFPNWTIEESRHIPITLKEARDCLRNFTAVKAESNCDINPLFCICDGSDKKKTVILGLSKYNHTQTYAVYVLGCFSSEHEFTTLEYMKNDHLKSVRKYSTVGLNIEYLITNTYNIYGCNLRNCLNIDNVDNNGSVSVLMSSNKYLSDCFETYSKIQVNLQVILGHRHSQVNFLWTQLEFLHKLIAKLTDTPSSKLEQLEICSDDGLDITSITNEICNCFSLSAYEKEDHKILDMENLRDKTILDYLWNILKRCKNVSDLRDSFYILFEELAEAQLKIQIPAVNESYIVNILNGILNGTLAVPTVTFSQSLEYLLELGLEYVKNEYLAIISHFCTSFHEVFLKKWSEACCEDATASSQRIKRKTRVTMMSKAAVINTQSINLRHLYLTQMHTLTEFLFLSKEHYHISEENFEDLCMTLYSHYMLNNGNAVKFAELQKQRLCEFSFTLNSIDSSFFKERQPVKRIIQMTSITDCAEIKTVFHLALHPIFPECIFNFDASLSSDDIYYVTKFVQFTEKTDDVSMYASR